MLLKGGSVLLPEGFVHTDLRFDGRILPPGPAPAGEEVFDAAGCFVLPGLVDIHTHGAAGRDFSDGRPDDLAPLLRWYAGQGVTGVVATAMTLAENDLTAALAALGAHRPGPGQARLLGVHLEGPFLSPQKCGAQDPGLLRAPDAELAKRWNEVCGGLVRRITVAPELDGALGFIRSASRWCTVSLGHTAADYETAMRAFDAGATQVTHLYNCMEGLHHRKPGLIAAAADAGAGAELICDGLHVHPAMVRLARAVFGPRLALISDSARCAGMPDGEYELGGQPITLRAGKAVLRGTDTLAGSSISLLDGLRRAVEFGAPLAEAARAATVVPARALGLSDAGEIVPGRPADLVVLDRDLALRAVFLGGERVGQRGGPSSSF